MLATEKVTRKSLDDDDHKRLIDDALGEVDFTALSGAEANGEERSLAWKRSDAYTATRCSTSPRTPASSMRSTSSSAQFADAMNENRDLQVFLFSPYFSSKEKREGLRKVVSGAEAEFLNFLELLAEKHRMPAIFHIRRRFDERWAEENRRLEVTLTSAVELDSTSSTGSARRSSARPTVRST